jgi:putative colanic acid biosynthesis UDP-glucose lipid carrier transferase
MSAERLSADPAAVSAPPDSAYGGTEHIRFGEPPSVGLLVLERIDLAVVVLSLYACLVAFQEPLTWDYAGLAGVAVILCGRFITPPNLRGNPAVRNSGWLSVSRLVMEWGTVVGLLLFAGFALKLSDFFSRAVLLTWFAVTAVALAVVQELQARTATWLNARVSFAPTFVIVGANKIGFELARRMPDKPFLGYFDFRSPERLSKDGVQAKVSGHCSGLGNYVRQRGVGAVYIALPISNAPRMRELLADLQNSTASIYFVPDVFAFDLIQGRVVDVNGIPVLAICDTPMRGTNAFVKRTLDLTLTLIGMIVLAPAAIVIAAAVKLSSSGPVLFSQRRYGVDGDEIVIYKFRTMTVCEDGHEIRQATRNDSRITPLGRLLRRTSLDELPQLINVLQGKMSLVGPRPHAVAHNEIYRRQISSYMVRHKVLPGITGWAQVHGLRGETDTIEKMTLRVRYDLEYLRNWSLALDLGIIFKTVLVLVRGRNAY